MAGLPYNLRVNVNVPFPALVTGAAGIKVTKVNGIWTIKPDFSALAPQVPAANQYATTYIEIWNSNSGVYSLVSFATLSFAASAISPTIVNTAGNYAAQSTDTLIMINAIVPQVLLQPSANRNGAPIAVKALAGAAAAANNITVTPNGTETIDGLSNYVISTNLGYTPKLYPIAGGWVTGP